MEDLPDERYGHIIINGIKTPVQERGLHIACVHLTESGRIKDVVHNNYDVFQDSNNANTLQVGGHTINNCIMFHMKNVDGITTNMLLWANFQLWLC